MPYVLTKYSKKPSAPVGKRNCAPTASLETDDTLPPAPGVNGHNPSAPVGKWTCAPTSSLEPYDTLPPAQVVNGNNLCGQCVSYVKKVCPGLPPTHLWRKGEQVRGNANIQAGTVIATFGSSGQYH